MAEDYFVEWRIDIFSAESARDAAEKARSYMPHPSNDSTATVFNVTDKDGNEVTVDLLEVE